MQNCYCPDIGNCEFYKYTIPLNKLQNINTHIGNHNRNYFFEIRVTNQANLSSTEYIDVLVDESPPAKGVVYEGNCNNSENCANKNVIWCLN